MAERPAGPGDCVATLTVKSVIPDVSELKPQASDWRLQVTLESEKLVWDFDDVVSLPITDVGELSGQIPLGCGKENVISVRADMLGRGESNPFSGLTHFWINRYKAQCPAVIRDIRLELSFKLHTKDALGLGAAKKDSFNQSLIQRRLSGAFNRLLPARSQLYCHVTFSVICDLQLTCVDGEVMQNSVSAGGTG